MGHNQSQLGQGIGPRILCNPQTQQSVAGTKSLMRNACGPAFRVQTVQCAHSQSVQFNKLQPSPPDSSKNKKIVALHNSHAKSLIHLFRHPPCPQARLNLLIDWSFVCGQWLGLPVEFQTFHPLQSNSSTSDADALCCLLLP